MKAKFILLVVLCLWWGASCAMDAFAADLNVVQEGHLESNSTPGDLGYMCYPVSTGATANEFYGDTQFVYSNYDYNNTGDNTFVSVYSYIYELDATSATDSRAQVKENFRNAPGSVLMNRYDCATGDVGCWNKESTDNPSTGNTFFSANTDYAMCYFLNSPNSELDYSIIRYRNPSVLSESIVDYYGSGCYWSGSGALPLECLSGGTSAEPDLWLEAGKTGSITEYSFYDSNSESVQYWVPKSSRRYNSPNDFRSPLADSSSGALDLADVPDISQTGVYSEACYRTFSVRSGDDFKRVSMTPDKLFYRSDNTIYADDELQFGLIVERTGDVYEWYTHEFPLVASGEEFDTGAVDFIYDPVSSVNDIESFTFLWLQCPASYSDLFGGQEERLSWHAFMQFETPPVDASTYYVGGTAGGYDAPGVNCPFTDTFWSFSCIVWDNTVGVVAQWFSSLWGYFSDIFSPYFSVLFPSFDNEEVVCFTYSEVEKCNTVNFQAERTLIDLAVFLILISAALKFYLSFGHKSDE